MTIDELEGKALAEAVALAEGWEKTEFIYNELWRRPGIPGAFPKVADYRPDRDITQAWELDGEGWRWEMWEFHNGYDDDGPIVGLATIVHVPGVDDAIKVHLNFNDFPTKSAAYATARCRAFLKAKAAQ